ncbi:hypothetical protein [Hydrogenophaga defluvii]|uniref:DUF3311 domain-containing protein n=1 Tax=Hydrogenophaga defluvii TaxID=249410 RepID=A0ABW2SAB1_9BURK
MLERLGTQRLLALFAAGWLLFNFPLLALWDHDATLWGLPLFPVALFVLWAALIVVLAWAVEQGANSRSTAEPTEATTGLANGPTTAPITGPDSD